MHLVERGAEVCSWEGILAPSRSGWEWAGWNSALCVCLQGGSTPPLQTVAGSRFIQDKNCVEQLIAKS